MCHVGSYRLGLNVGEAHEETELRGVKTSSKKNGQKNIYRKCNEGHDDEDDEDQPQPELGGLVGAGTCIDTAESYGEQTEEPHRQPPVTLIFPHLSRVNHSGSDQLRDLHYVRQWRQMTWHEQPDLK